MLKKCRFCPYKDKEEGLGSVETSASSTDRAQKQTFNISFASVKRAGGRKQGQERIRSADEGLIAWKKGRPCLDGLPKLRWFDQRLPTLSRSTVRLLRLNAVIH